MPETDLRHCNFAKQKLLKIDLHGADLTKVDFSNAKMTDCNFNGAVDLPDEVKEKLNDKGFVN